VEAKIHLTLSLMTLHVMSLARLVKHKIAPLAHIRFYKSIEKKVKDNTTQILTIRI
jgi:cell fate (sporulation/competence/biofilm development) regulator YmcA (YheA/YmcA/DUF963 family)